MRRVIIFLILIALYSPIIMADVGHEHSSERHAHEGPEKGPHGGRMLRDGVFGFELKIFEDGTAPQFRGYAYEDDQPLSAADVSASVHLERFGGVTNDFNLIPQNEYLTSNATVHEPHSFKVKVSVKYRERDFEWNFESFEGRTVLGEEALNVAGLAIDRASSQKIADSLKVYGRILTNENKTAHITPRFPGILKEIKKSLGDYVKKGETVALIEANQSLKVYEVTSEISGVVLFRHATLGEFIPDLSELFIISDLSEVWADFQVYRDDFEDIAVGQEITVDLGNGREVVPAKITYISPVTDEATQSKLIRATLPNADLKLKPGLFVSAVINAKQEEVPVAVKREAIQTFRDWNVVYLTDGHTFQAMPVELGRKDSQFVEILSGIKAGDTYVSQNSFIIKADIEKSGASHDH